MVKHSRTLANLAVDDQLATETEITLINIAISRWWIR